MRYQRSTLDIIILFFPSLFSYHIFLPDFLEVVDDLPGRLLEVLDCHIFSMGFGIDAGARAIAERKLMVGIKPKAGQEEIFIIHECI